MPLTLITDDQLENPVFVAQEGLTSDNVACLKILNSTLLKFDQLGGEQEVVNRATQNHKKWAEAAQKNTPETPPRVRVVDQDWGVTTLERTKATGATYAVLNMANAEFPGGHYRTGGFAQEENIFWRTNCHYHIKATQVADNHYTAEMTALINGEQGKVYLDMEMPRVCIRGPGGRNGTPYEFLKEDDYFLFHELRSAAQCLTYPKDFSEDKMRSKIHAQLQTLKDAGVKHVILSAFGCGMFNNPPTEVARIYREELSDLNWAFEDITFAIAGGDKTNFNAFYGELDGLGLTQTVRDADKTLTTADKSWLQALKNNLELPKWQTKGASILFFPQKTPQGIQNILRILNNPNMDDSAKLQAIRTIAQERLAHKPWFTKRDDEVNTLYIAITNLDPQNPSASIATISAPTTQGVPQAPAQQNPPVF